MSQTRNVVLLLSLGLLGSCRRQVRPETHADAPAYTDSVAMETPPRVDTAMGPWRPDTLAFTVTKPVLIAVAAIAQQDLDADTSQALIEIVDDFNTYLGEIHDSLTKIGADFRTAATTTVRLRTDSSWTEWSLARGRVGYLFAAPGHKPMLIMDVDTAEDLIPRFRAYLRGAA